MSLQKFSRREAAAIFPLILCELFSLKSKAVRCFNLWLKVLIMQILTIFFSFSETNFYFIETFPFSNCFFYCLHISSKFNSLKLINIIKSTYMPFNIIIVISFCLKNCSQNFLNTIFFIFSDLFALMQSKVGCRA